VVDPGNCERGSLTLNPVAPLWRSSNSLAPTVQFSMSSLVGVLVSAEVIRCSSECFERGDIHDLYSEGRMSGLSRRVR
jgi:hypothetical protein